MKFGKFELAISESSAPLSIAEIGVNHNGSIDIAETLILSARRAGADIIKLQSFVSEEEISRFADQCDYQKQSESAGETQLEMAKALELSFDQLASLVNFCDSNEIPWLFTAFESISLDFLVERLNVRSLKIASSEITNFPLLREIGGYGLDVILSTGASTLEEVRLAVAALKDAGVGELVVLHCVSSYPTPDEQLNLSAINTMRAELGVPIGFSDHTDGHEAAGLSVLCGASVVEKHITLDTRMDGPDHIASVTPDDFAAMVRGMNRAWILRGDGVKKPVACEIDNLPLIRKSIVVRTDLPKGHQLTMSDLACKRPGTGIQPIEIDRIVGATLTRPFSADEPLQWDGLLV